MKRMTWMHSVDGEMHKETVLLMGVSFRGPNTVGYDNTTYACIMDADQKYHKVPISQLMLSTEDYNKVFAE